MKKNYRKVEEIEAELKKEKEFNTSINNELQERQKAVKTDEDYKAYMEWSGPVVTAAIQSDNKVRVLETELRISTLFYAKVGDKVHIDLWSDTEPATIIKRTPTTITVQIDKAELDPSWKPDMTPGGFCAHCNNNDEQRWNITRDENGSMQTYRWSYKHNCFCNSGDQSVRVRYGWQKFYDYNF